MKTSLMWMSSNSCPRPLVKHLDQLRSVLSAWILERSTAHREIATVFEQFQQIYWYCEWLVCWWVGWLVDVLQSFLPSLQFISASWDQLQIIPGSKLLPTTILVVASNGYGFNRHHVLLQVARFWKWGIPPRSVISTHSVYIVENGSASFE